MMTVLNKELQVGRVITATNIVIAIMAAIPAILCFLFTADAYFPTESPVTDRFPDPPADLETKILFSIASLLLLIFYRYVFLKTFLYTDIKLSKRKRLNYYLQVIVVNVLTLMLFIYFTKDQFIPHDLDKNAEGVPYIYLFLYLPFIPLIMASIGCYYNLKQKQINISNEN